MSKIFLKVFSIFTKDEKSRTGKLAEKEFLELGRLGQRLLVGIA